MFDEDQPVAGAVAEDGFDAVRAVGAFLEVLDALATRSAKVLWQSSVAGPTPCIMPLAMMRRMASADSSSIGGPGSIRASSSSGWSARSSGGA
ncbi:hypothetical protein ACIA49_24835 [Kribbella sp. NPDC051587]|uniref:hypothetical protein n=1 Tax=Kribbella sp. NPDC051587 TaxID=3364119 RepID=UPI003791655A